MSVSIARLLRLLPVGVLAALAVMLPGTVSSSAAAPAAASVTAPAVKPAPARLLVLADEWSLVLSRLKVKAGPVIVQYANQGEDAHDLRLRRIDRRSRPRALAARSMAETGAGELTESELRLRRGKWRLWCSLPGHRKAGMRATLSVR